MIDPAGRLLLFRSEIGGRPPWWFAPGGALEPGESGQEALARELAEETGISIAAADLGSPVWTRDVLFSWQGVMERHLEQYFVVRVVTAFIDTSAYEASPPGVTRTHRWWTALEIAASADGFAPASLAQHVDPILRGEVPTTPVELSD